MALTRDQILAKDDLPKKEVHVPEWGDTVFVRMLTGSEKDRLEGHLQNRFNNGRANIAALSICDSAGNLLFKPEEVEALGKKSAAALDRIFEAVIDMNTFTASDVDELEKKLEKTPS